MPAEIGAPETVEQDEGQQPASKLTPIDFQAIGYVPGKYAPWPCSPEPCYGPDELGVYQKAIDDMTQNVNKCDSAARIWEVLQAWEMRLFRRNYHFLNAGWKGWGMFGGSSGTTGQSIMQTQNAMKLFSCNVFGTRHKKITSLLSREVPEMEVMPAEEGDPIDEAASEEAEKYLDAYLCQREMKEVVKKTAGYFCTDDRVGLLTYTWADQTRWGTEAQEREDPVYGWPKSAGISPETELDSGGENSAAPESEASAGNGMEGAAPNDRPARKEATFVAGKLECKVPLMSDEEEEMPWVRFQHETSVNLLKAKYPWVKAKIATQGNVGGMDQIDRLARINVRLAVQASSSSGEAWKNDATETTTFFRPSEYESIEDADTRQLFYDEFPDGLEVWHAGGQLAFVRNGSMSKHVKIVHPYPGDGQNREAILTNYLPLQKVLNANISLVDRYFRSGVPRRYVMEPYIDSQLLNTQANDPAKVTPVYISEGSQLRIPDLTGVENVPTLNTAIMEFVQWLIQGGPEAMDGGSPAAFGEVDTEGDQGVFKTTRLRRDQALQVFATPWDGICEAVEAISLQSIESAAANRLTNTISMSIPGQQRLQIEVEKLQGSVLIQRASNEIPRSMAEEEEQMAELLAQSGNVALYQQIMMDPSNLAVFAKFPTLKKLNVPGADQVEQQQGEFEILMRSGPQPNPQYLQIQEQLQGGEAEVQRLTQAALIDPNAAAELQQVQQALQQLQQALQQTPPEISTVPVAQDTSENHAIHAAITLGFLTSPTGRKLKNGTDEQKTIWQNFKLHWMEHMQVLKQLQPPPQVEMRASITVDPTKLPPEAQAKAFQRLGLQVSPEEVTPEPSEHEIVQEKEGVDENGVPTKTKVSLAGKPLE